jgi:putative methionine-R-sulfoxide reductase with GAF domain
MTVSPTRPARDYARLSGLLRPGPVRQSTMASAVDALWDVLAPTSVSWLGFYTKSVVGAEMTLGARRDKPACSPISLEGMCGRSFLARRPIVLRDARTLTSGYIACDPNDRGEVVIPLLEADGSCWGVLDLDSYEPGAFDERDAAELTRLMEQVGLSAPPAQRPGVMHF